MWATSLVFALLVAVACGETPTPPTRFQRLSCNTTKGRLDIDLAPDWSPQGVQRVVDMAASGFFKDIAFFRAVRGFLVQFGLSGDTALQAQWNYQIPDDPSLGIPFYKGMVAFAGNGVDSRTSQIFFALENQFFLGQSPWETALGFVTPATMPVIDAIYTGYGDCAPWGNGPSQDRIFAEGSAYLKRDFPLLDYIHDCVLVNDPCSLPDKYSDCKGWSTPGNTSPAGECVANAKWMQSNCPVSCATCAANATLGSGSTRCTNAYAECLPWAVPGRFSAQGECVRNPDWMAKYCGRACSFCEQ